MINITYNDLVALRAANNLVTDTEYRITDYEATSTLPTTSITSHPFDIIVQALNTSILRRTAKLIKKAADTYYGDLNACACLYTIDNDATKYDWADTVNGKGVIFYLCDEFNNTADFDFKQIQTGGKYLFGTATVDNSIAGTVANASISTDKATKTIPVANLIGNNITVEGGKNITVVGNDNVVGPDNDTVTITGNNNNIDSGNKNININGSTTNIGKTNTNITLNGSTKTTIGNNNTGITATTLSTTTIGDDNNAVILTGVNDSLIGDKNDTITIEDAKDVVIQTSKDVNIIAVRDTKIINTGNVVKTNPLVSNGTLLNNSNSINLEANDNIQIQDSFGVTLSETASGLVIDGVSNQTLNYNDKTIIKEDGKIVINNPSGTDQPIIIDSEGNEQVDTEAFIKDAPGDGLVYGRKDGNWSEIDTSGGDVSIIPTTWLDLVNLRNNNLLVPGQLYRITDYTTTTSQADTSVAGNDFDIVVVALSESTLSEKASVVQRDGTTYFDGQKLSSWQIKYNLDNDNSKFEWADTSIGKGVIYRMIDEFNNDVSYDFKNIQFLNNGVYVFTFGGATDDSLTGKSVGNTIKESIVSNKLSLNFNTFGTNCNFNVLGFNNNNTTFGDYCNSNAFDDECRFNKFGDDCFFNTFGNSCRFNTLSNESGSNTFGLNCWYNTFGDSCYSNNFGDGCISNNLSDYCSYNTFGNECTSNNLDEESTSNIFGDYCGNNTFGAECRHNKFGNNYYNNEFGNECSVNRFGTDCNSNIFGESCQYNTFGNDCDNNTFNNYYSSNTFGDYCSNNNFYHGTSGTVKKDFIKYVVLEEGCSRNNFYSPLTTSGGAYLRRIRIKGLDNATPTNIIITLSETSTDYEWVISRAIDGTINQYSPKDHTLDISDLQTNKANKASTLSGYGIEDAYTKVEINNKISAVFRYKGNVPTYAALTALTGMVTGDVYNVTNTGVNYAWTGSAWESLAGTIDLSAYLEKTEAVDTYETIENVSSLNDTVSEHTGYISNLQTNKQNKLIAGDNIVFSDNVISAELDVNLDDYLTIDEASNTYETVANVQILNNTVSGHTGDIESLEENKANKATTLSGYGITDAVTESTMASHVASNLHLTEGQRTKLAGIAAGAEVNVNADWNATTGDARILNKPTSMPASDVSAWAKAATKPSYTASEIGGLGANYRWLTDSYINTWNAKEPAITKLTAFNKNFGNTAGTVSEGNHTHTFASLTSKPSTLTDYGITDVPNDNKTYGRLNGDWSEIDTSGGGGASSTIPITWSALKALRDTKKLTPGQSYRITDYVCTTTTRDSQAANNLFDIVVIALDKNYLSENASATYHEGDTYFSSNKSKLESWKLKYRIDNDTARFDWVNPTTGKGVIYYMKDDYNNEVPYDFKNIKFNKNGVWLYTFGGALDSSVYSYYSSTYSVNMHCKNNIIGGYYTKVNNDVKYKLSFNTFGQDCYSNTLGNNCNNNTFGNSCHSNTFGVNCYSNTFGNNCQFNTFGNGCYSNVFDYNFKYNKFSDNCYSNTFGDNCNGNTFGYYCFSNTFGNQCISNTFGDRCRSNTFGDIFQFSTFGNQCYYNNFYDGPFVTTKKNYIRYIVLEDAVCYNDFYSNVTTSNNNYLQRIRIKGLEHSAPTPIQINLSTVNTKYEWVIAKNSSNVIKQYCPEDLVP